MEMKQEEILRFAQQDGKRGQEFERREANRGVFLGTLVAIIIGIVLFLLEYYILGNINIGLLVVGITAAAVQALYEGIRTRTIWLIILGAVEAVLSLVTILAFIGKLVVKS